MLRWLTPCETAALTALREYFALPQVTVPEGQARGVRGVTRALAEAAKSAMETREKRMVARWVLSDGRAGVW